MCDKIIKQCEQRNSLNFLCKRYMFAKDSAKFASDSWTHIERLRLAVRQNGSLMPSDVESFVCKYSFSNFKMYFSNMFNILWGLQKISISLKVWEWQSVKIFKFSKQSGQSWMVIVCSWTTSWWFWQLTALFCVWTLTTSGKVS